MSGHLFSGGRPLNPDTDLPMPSPSAPQEQLADALLARLLDDPPFVEALSGHAGLRELLRDALVEVAVRQHGRTVRAVRDELDDAATGYESDARALAERGLALDEPFTPDRAASIARLTTAARALRSIVLGGWRA